jgi:hypothetical protein
MRDNLSLSLSRNLKAVLNSKPYIELIELTRTIWMTPHRYEMSVIKKQFIKTNFNAE